MEKNIFHIRTTDRFFNLKAQDLYNKYISKFDKIKNNDINKIKIN